jgi:predicted phosphodiesterase
MKVAVISDSHDNLKGLKWAFETINSLGIENVIHLGDVISPFVPMRIAEIYRGFGEQRWGSHKAFAKF